MFGVKRHPMVRITRIPLNGEDFRRTANRDTSSLQYEMRLSAPRLTEDCGLEGK
jgi:hypothetical protein